MPRPSHTELNDLSFDMNFDPEAAQRIRDIAAAKDRAVRVEVRGYHEFIDILVWGTFIEVVVRKVRPRFLPAVCMSC